MAIMKLSIFLFVVLFITIILINDSQVDVKTSSYTSFRSSKSRIKTTKISNIELNPKENLNEHNKSYSSITSNPENFSENSKTSHNKNDSDELRRIVSEKKEYNFYLEETVAEWKSKYEALLTTYMSDKNIVNESILYNIECRSKVCRIEFASTDKKNATTVLANLMVKMRNTASWDINTIHQLDDSISTILYIDPDDSPLTTKKPVIIKSKKSDLH